jgi:glycosyltransferase involved in cell wall biosynthesis
MNKTAFVAFYAVYPSNMGSSEVSSSFFESWIGVKKLFQISHINRVNNRKIHTQFISKEKPVNKILNIVQLARSVKQFLLGSYKPNIIIEGPSWIGYSFIFFIISKILIPKAFIIYHSHSIEYEIRKKNSNYLIYFLTKLMENYIFNNACLATSVSIKEKNKIKKLYNKETVIFPNGVCLKKLQNKKNKILLPKNYIFYSGSYLYGPNKEAINFLNNYFMPKLIKIFSNLKLVLTGGGYNLNHSWLLNLGVVSKEHIVKLLKNSQLILIPIYEGYGTRIKIIEALMLGIPVVSSPKGIEGIDYKLNEFKSILVHKNKSILLEYTKNVLKNNQMYKKNSKKNKNKYIAIYDMKKIVKKFQLFLLKKIKNA